jgi:putative ABC transport system permease protein
VVWGTSSVIFLMSWGAGLNVMVEHSFEKIGKNMILAFPGHVGEDFTPAVDRRYLWFTLEDVEAVRKRMRLAEIAVGESELWASVTYRQKMLTMDVKGIEPRQLELRGVPLAAGRGLRNGDLDYRRRVAILGSKARLRLLGSQGGVGSRIRIDGRSFEVIGILERVGTQLWRGGATEIDDQVWIPITTLFAFGPRWGVDEEIVDHVQVRIPHRNLKEQAKRELRAVLAERLRVSPTDTEAIHVVGPLDMLEKLPVNETGGIFLLISLTTLLIGGIGVLNLMLESVQERRQEIGVRMAVGARRREVISQFLVETLVITGLGGGTGIALGVALSWGLSRLETPDLIPLPILQGWSVALATGVLALVGVLAGVLPAWRASHVDPALTLRAE